MQRILVRFALVGAVSLAAAGIAAAEEKKEPSAKSQETAKKLKGDVGKFGLSIYGWVGKDSPYVSFVTDKELARQDLARPMPRISYVITEDVARSLIDGLVNIGQFDVPVHIPPPGVPVPGWYLSVWVGQPPTVHYYWLIGDDKSDLSTNAAVGQVVKIVEGDGKKALQEMIKKTAAKR